MVGGGKVQGPREEVCANGLDRVVQVNDDDERLLPRTWLPCLLRVGARCRQAGEG